MIQRVIVAGGGTGGHLFPGIAVVEELRRRNPELEVLYVGTARGIEARVIPGMGEQLETLDVQPLKGRTFAQLLGSLVKLPSAWGRAVSILRQHRPDVVLGVGGYASGPMLVAAATLGIKTALLEQNAAPGLTNRVLAHVVGRAYLTFPETAATFGRAARVVGNPVRRAFVEAAKAALVDPVGFDARARRLFVLGGSQGARALNRTVPEALARLDLGARGIGVLHQTGAAMRDEVAARYRELGVDAEVVPFVDDVARAYAESSLVVCRAGASTLAELCALGRPSVLIPFPFAADDHQAKNAESLERDGAALCIRESVLDAERLAAELRALLDAPDRRRAMAEAARRRGRPDAAASIVDDLATWVDGEAPSSSPSGASHRSSPGNLDAAALDAEPLLAASRTSSGALQADDADASPPVVTRRTAPGMPSPETTASSADESPYGHVDFREGRALRVRATRTVPRLSVAPYAPRPTTRPS